MAPLSHLIVLFLFRALVPTFEVEWNEFCEVLQILPNKNRQTILSQLLIMTNGRTKNARFKMAKLVSKMISSREEEKPESFSRLKPNLQTLARLHREQRKLLGKMIFDAIAELYGGDKKDQKV